MNIEQNDWRVRMVKDMKRKCQECILIIVCPQILKIIT